MNIRYYLLGSVFSLFVSCSPSLQLANVEANKNISVAQEIEEKKELVEMIAPYKKQLEVKMGQKVSYTLVELTRAGDNSSLGAVLVDFLYEGATEWAKKNKVERIDAAVLNIGGIRSNLAKGDILVKHIFEVMPFENEMVIVKMKGEDLQGLFQYYERTKKNNPVSRLYIELENGKLVKNLINGEVPQKDKEYYIATSDYLALGGDYMTFFAKGKILGTNIRLRELFMEYFRKNPEIKANTDIRLKFK